MVWKTIGMLAALLTTFGFIPQIIKMVKTKSARDLSMITLIQYFVGVTLWALYGMYLKDPIIILANSVTLLTLAVAIFLHFKFETKKY